MQKSIIVGIITFIIGIGIGASGHWYFTDHLPEARIEQAALDHQKEINQMYRAGKVLDVKPNEITIKVENSGDEAEEGKEITVTTDADTSIQEGMEFLSTPGQTYDLTTRLEEGMQVDLMVQDGKALAVHWAEKKEPEQESQGG